MNEKFDAEDLIASVPKLLTSKEGGAALKRLRAKAGFDYDAFRDDLVGALSQPHPLGPTPECLTIDEIAQSVEPAQFLDLESALANRITTHLPSCAECWENVVLYRKLERTSWIRGIEAGVETPVHAWIDPEVHWSPGGSPAISIELAPGTGPDAGELSIERASVVLLGSAAPAYRCEIQANDPSTGELLLEFSLPSSKIDSAFGFVGVEATIIGTQSKLRSSGLVRLSRTG